MERDQAIAKLVSYAVEKGLVRPEERIWAVNTLLDILRVDSCALPEVGPVGEEELPAILEALTDDACARGMLPEDTVTYRDLFDTRLMGALTPRPAQVIDTVNGLYRQDAKAATHRN